MNLLWDIHSEIKHKTHRIKQWADLCICNDQAWIKLIQWGVHHTFIHNRFWSCILDSCDTDNVSILFLDIYFSHLLVCARESLLAMWTVNNPVLTFLKMEIASRCDRPWTLSPLIERISSPKIRRKKSQLDRVFISLLGLLR